MALRTIAVPQPAAGADWSYTVPGQYVLDLVAVTATLGTSLKVTSIADETGNGHTLTPADNAHYTTGAAGPYGGGTSDYGVHGDGAVSPTGGYATSAAAAAFVTATGTVDFWFYCDKASDANSRSIVELFSPGNNRVHLGLWVAASSSDPYGILPIGSGTGGVASPALASRFAWHHIAVTYDGTQYAFYVDGAAGPTNVGHQPSAGDSPAQVRAPGGNGTGFTCPGTVAGLAYYNTVLTGGNIAAHAAANSSWAAYRAAVLADSPVAFYGFNTVTTLTQRTVTLEITDGTNVVASFPGFAPTQTGNEFTFTWLANAGSTVQSADQSTTVVAIPRMILPPGYVIRTRTVDLSATDQWSNETIWWNDSLSPGTGGIGAYVYPPGVRLAYHKQGV